jgi:hypothetical protein
MEDLFATLPTQTAYHITQMSFGNPVYSICQKHTNSPPPPYKQHALKVQVFYPMDPSLILVCPIVDGTLITKSDLHYECHILGIIETPNLKYKLQNI